MWERIITYLGILTKVSLIIDKTEKIMFIKYKCMI